jgi:hypothetical protein
LEAAYLSLFTGKTISRTKTRSWFITPEAGSSPSSYRLGMFSEQLGFVPPDLLEGAPISVEIEPTGVVSDAAGQFGPSTQPLENVLIYRLPDVVVLKVNWGDVELYEQRLSLYQAGSTVTYPVTD